MAFPLQGRVITRAVALVRVQVVAPAAHAIRFGFVPPVWLVPVHLFIVIPVPGFPMVWGLLRGPFFKDFGSALCL